ncbi:MAG: YbaB/EbfC family nucleoid-associated protein [Patescibacteria group bacterium]
MFDKIKQLKELRDQAKQMKEMLDKESVIGTSGSGQVSIVMDGNQEVLSANVDSSLLQPESKEKLEQYIREATNDAIKKVQRVLAQKMQSLPGFNLPGM